MDLSKLIYEFLLIILIEIWITFYKKSNHLNLRRNGGVWVPNCPAVKSNQCLQFHISLLHKWPPRVSWSDCVLLALPARDCSSRLPMDSNHWNRSTRLNENEKPQEKKEPRTCSGNKERQGFIGLGCNLHSMGGLLRWCAIFVTGSSFHLFYGLSTQTNTSCWCWSAVRIFALDNNFNGQLSSWQGRKG